MFLKTLILTWCLTLPLTTFAQDQELYTSETIPKILTVKADAVVRQDHVAIDLNSENDMSMTCSRIVTIFNERGNKHTQAIVGYDDSRKIKKIEAHIYNASGEEIKKIKKKDFMDYSAVDGGTLYSDSRVLVMNYDPIDYPYTVHFTFTMDTPDTAGIPGWRPLDAYNVSVENSSYTLTDHAGLGLRHKDLHFDGYPVEANNTPNSLNYKLENVPAFVQEDLSPNLEVVMPRVMVATERFHYGGLSGSAKDWNEFGNWVRTALLAGRDEISNDTKNTVSALVSDCATNREKAEKIFKFVQDNTRYISVQVGIGGIQPISAMEVDQVKYGDCKGLSNYTKALLNSVGVESYYTVVQAGPEISDFDPEFATLGQGNHIILAIPDQDDMIWIDCTSQVHPFGFIGDFTDNRNVLVIKPDGSEILKTEAYIDSANYQLTQASAIIEPDARLVADVEITTKGVQYDNRFKIQSASEKDQHLYYNNYWSNINNLDITSKTHKNDLKNIKFTEVLTIKANMFASLNGDKLIFTPNAFNRSSYVPERIRNRKLPMIISRGYLDEDSYTFKIPEGYKVEAMPEPLNIVNDFGEYSIESSLKNDSEIIYTRKLLIKKGDYQKSRYDDYRDFRKEVSKGDKAIIVLSKTI